MFFSEIRLGLNTNNAQLDLNIKIYFDFYYRYPRIEFFHTNYIHDMMVAILFVYAKLHTDISYRQVASM